MSVWESGYYQQKGNSKQVLKLNFAVETNLNMDENRKELSNWKWGQESRAGPGHVTAAFPEAFVCILWVW